jgi:hypothetical protein
MSGILQLLLQGGSEPPIGAATLTSVGTGTFVVPEGVRSISVLGVAGGGAGGGGVNTGNFSGAGGGQGGALSYRNNIPVTPGESLGVYVGEGGGGGAGDDGAPGGDTWLKRGGTYLLRAVGGRGGENIHGGGEGNQTSSAVGDVKIPGADGGRGQGGGAGAGGGAAAGYTGGERTENTGSPTSASSGSWASDGGAGGGGVGLVGLGANGAAAEADFENVPGLGGSGGSDGSGFNREDGGGGGAFGGGGGGGQNMDGEMSNSRGGNGGQGGMTILWGDGFIWPSPPPLPEPEAPPLGLGLSPSLLTLTGPSDEWTVQSVDMAAFAGVTARPVFRVEIGTTGTVYLNDVQIDAVAFDDVVWNFGSTTGWQTGEAAVGLDYDEVPSWFNIQSANTDGYWCQDNGPTPSGGTGGLSPFSGGDVVYTETSSPVQNGDVFWLRGPIRTLSGDPSDLQFREGRDITGADTTLSVHLYVESLP